VSFPEHGGLRCLELGTPGEMRQRLVALVLAGQKRATAGLLSEYHDEGEPLEAVGEEQWLLGDDGTPLTRVRYTRVEVVPFAEVTWEFAQAEGEGFTDLEHWRAGHRRFWSRWYGVDPDDPSFPAHDAAPVACLWFELVPGSDASP